MISPIVQPTERHSLVSNAGTSKDPVRFFLAGDLFQLALQEKALLDSGLHVGRLDIYPGLYDLDDFKKALAFIWAHKLDGWQHYRADFLRHSICSEAEFAVERF